METQEHQERQLDHRFQLALYKEKKLQELEKVRGMYVCAEYKTVLDCLLLYLILKIAVFNVTFPYHSITIFLLSTERLVKEYAEKMATHERRQCQALKERQDTFGQVFQEDLEQFKQSGKLPGNFSCTSIVIPFLFYPYCPFQTSHCFYSNSFEGITAWTLPRRSHLRWWPSCSRSLSEWYFLMPVYWNL